MQNEQHLVLDQKLHTFRRTLDHVSIWTGPDRLKFAFYCENELPGEASAASNLPSEGVIKMANM